MLEQRAGGVTIPPPVAKPTLPDSGKLIPSGIWERLWDPLGEIPLGSHEGCTPL